MVCIWLQFAYRSKKLRHVLLMLCLWQTFHKSSQESLTRICGCLQQCQEGEEGRNSVEQTDRARRRPGQEARQQDCLQAWGSTWQTLPSMTCIWSWAPQASHFPIASKYRWGLTVQKEGLMSAALQSSALQTQMEISTVHFGDLWHSLKNSSLSRHV